MFCCDLEFEEWPGVHTNNDFVQVPYNGSIYDLRKKYNEVFPKLPTPTMKELNEGSIHKITYSINLLPKFDKLTNEKDSSLVSELTGYSGDD